MTLPHLSFAETKSTCFLAYDAVEGEQYRFPDDSLWYVEDDWNSIFGFKAILIRPRSASRHVTVLSFAGTDSVIDVVADIRQVGGGLPIQYMQALLRTAECQGLKYGSSLHLTGHSLGGGLAAFCSVNLRIPASTINPAPLVGAANLSALFGNHSQITNYVASGGEVVSSSPGRNPGKAVTVPARGNFFTRHLLANVAPSVALPTPE